MELETYLSKMVSADRSETLKRSPQLLLGELILKVESILNKHSEKIGTKDEPTVDFDFGSAIPTSLDSWRGSYEELAIGYKLTGYDGDSMAEVSISDFLNELKSAVGKSFEGWKGGSFHMSKNTPVWVSNPGNTGNTGIVEVVDDEWRIILMTAYCKF